MAHDLDLGIFGPLRPEQILYLTTCLIDEGTCRRYGIELDDLFALPRGKSRASAKHRKAIEALTFYVETHCPDEPPIPAQILRSVLARMAEVDWSSSAKYSLWVQLFSDPWWTFLNFGYHDNAFVRRPLALRGAEATWPFAVQLYDRLAGLADLRGRDVLEVGSGRGGGAAYLARTRRVRSLVGLDSTASNILFSQRNHRRETLTFVTGVAEDLPFPDASFDAVVNVQSCALFSPLKRFVSEARRILRPGGSLLMAFDAAPIEALNVGKVIRADSFVPVREEDITAGVQLALREFQATGIARILMKNRLVHRAVVYDEFLRRTFQSEAISSGSSCYLTTAYRKVP